MRWTGYRLVPLTYSTFSTDENFITGNQRHVRAHWTFGVFPRDSSWERESQTLVSTIQILTLASHAVYLYYDVYRVVYLSKAPRTWSCLQTSQSSSALSCSPIEKTQRMNYAWFRENPHNFTSRAANLYLLSADGIVFLKISSFIMLQALRGQKTAFQTLFLPGSQEDIQCV